MQALGKKPPVFTGLLLCILGIVGIRMSEPAETTGELAIMIIASIMLVASMVINGWYLVYSLKRARRKN